MEDVVAALAAAAKDAEVVAAAAKEAAALASVAAKAAAVALGAAKAASLRSTAAHDAAVLAEKASAAATKSAAVAKEAAAAIRKRKFRRIDDDQSAVPPASLPDDDDMLQEIFLRLPQRLSSLPRASLVCKRWRRLVSEPAFLRRFRARKAPLLGVFDKYRIVFTPVADGVNPERFSLGRFSEDYLLGCRHGRILFVSSGTPKVVAVCDPVKGKHDQLAYPPEFELLPAGTVVCADTNQGHVHGRCHSSPYKVVLMSSGRDNKQPFARVYSSETGTWGNVITTPVPRQIGSLFHPSILVGNAIYWYDGYKLLELDLDRQSLALFKGPPRRRQTYHYKLIKSKDGGVGLATLSYPSLQIWNRNVDSHDVTTWVLWKTVDLHNILGRPDFDESMVIENIQGYSEDDDALFILVDSGVFMLQLESMQSRRLFETNCITTYHAFTSFYTEGVGGLPDTA